MPTKHIDAAQWEQIEELTLELTKLTNQVVKESEVLKIIINRGLTNYTETEIAMQLAYKPRYNVILYVRYSDEARLSTQLERPLVKDALEVISDDVPFMMCVYGKTNTGKSLFAENIANALPEREITVYDESHPPYSEQVKNAWRDYYSGKSAVLVIHAVDLLSSMNILFPLEERKFTIEEPSEIRFNRKTE
ncbi:hypothetical protein K6W81_20885 [Enterobacter sp. MW07]|nr:hypothetical protein [Enterobacter sp. MW07]